MLPDSRANISVADKGVLQFLDYHPDNLLPLTVIPTAVNGNNMILLESVPITFYLQQRHYNDNLHFFSVL